MNTNKLSRVLAAVVVFALASNVYSAVTVSFTDSSGGTNNLPALGSTDWVSLGPATHGRNEKIGADHIGAVTAVGGATIQQVTSGNWYSTWTGGTPTNSATAVKGKWEAKASSGSGGHTFSVSGLADGAYSMTIYATKYQCNGELTASIGTTSNSAAFTTGGTGATTYYGVFIINFDITSSETLNIDYLFSAHAGGSSDNLGVAAITLSKNLAVVSVDELGTSAASVNPINLTSEGTADWVKLGATGEGGTLTRNEKVGADYIGAVNIVAATPYASAGGSFTSDWTDGTPSNSATSVAQKWEAKSNSGSGGHSFSVSGLPRGIYTLKVYATKYNCNGRLFVSGGAGSTSVVFDDGGTAGTRYAVFTIESALTPSSTINIDYLFSAHAGTSSDNLGIHAITLSLNPPTGSIFGIY